ncbi:plasmid pRiA4b ORF-3 family protein [Wolbachia endosymbiont (group A) of Cydia splendana]|uniref:plasmid pRiA4b ORF-3 family protein n=1 Tax=Wolbachia endosymbiont (group A) of Cydia splendana TaxID=2954000 RepID=UPI0021F86C18|nr:plasmid pRiA4b ORF-3 family protein [Wolbachia endosymbiont (group A) of Cydia splendana]
MDNKEKVYLFKLSLNKKIYREMALKGRTSLYTFAKEIVGAFDFEFDHAFGFYDNIKDIHESSEAYTLFYDFGDPVNDNEKSVKKSYIYKVFQLNKKMLFLFDYGDNWDFLVECCGVIEAEIGKRYPKITKKQGEAPPQYPDYDI